MVISCPQWRQHAPNGYLCLKMGCHTPTGVPCHTKGDLLHQQRWHAPMGISVGTKVKNNTVHMRPTLQTTPSLTHCGVWQRIHLLSTFHHTVVNSSTSVAGNIQFPLSGLSPHGQDGPACFGWSSTVGYCTSGSERNSTIKRRKCCKCLPC